MPMKTAPTSAQCGGPGVSPSVVRFRTYRWAALLIAGPLVPRCTALDSGPGLLTAETPLHLEEHLDSASIVGSEPPMRVLLR